MTGSTSHSPLASYSLINVLTSAAAGLHSPRSYCCFCWKADIHMRQMNQSYEAAISSPAPVPPTPRPLFSHPTPPPPTWARSTTSHRHCAARLLLLRLRVASSTCKQILCIAFASLITSQPRATGRHNGDANAQKANCTAEPGVVPDNGSHRWIVPAVRLPAAYAGPEVALYRAHCSDKGQREDRMPVCVAYQLPFCRWVVGA